MNTNLPPHSKLGASSAERWLECPGSVAVNAVSQADDPEYREDGTRAHDIAAKALVGGEDAWEFMDDKFTDEHALAVQVYLDKVRPLIKSADVVRIEQRIYRPDLHPLYYGTADLAVYFNADELLDVTDYKHGEGLEVEVEWNPQVMYYAYGLLDQFPNARKVTMRIVQPRLHTGPNISEWTVDRVVLEKWALETLLPGMVRAEKDGTLKPGPWCRFCNKLRCPVLTSMYIAATAADPTLVKDKEDGELAEEYRLREPAKFYLRQLETEMHGRLSKGHTMLGLAKLVAKKANRVFKQGAEAIFKARFEDKAYTRPALKSPAELEKLGQDAKELVKEWCYVPFTGTTVAMADDKREAIPVRTATDAYAGYIKEHINDDV